MSYLDLLAAATSTVVRSPEGGTFDRVSSVAAIVAIVVVAIAGIYIYRLIRRGL